MSAENRYVESVGKTLEVPVTLMDLSSGDVDGFEFDQRHRNSERRQWKSER
jgi:hypothetical protein